jgi:hypothetical protein
MLVSVRRNTLSRGAVFGHAALEYAQCLLDPIDSHPVVLLGAAVLTYRARQAVTDRSDLRALVETDRYDAFIKQEFCSRLLYGGCGGFGAAINLLP